MSVNKEAAGAGWRGWGVACMKALLVVCPGRLRPPRATEDRRLPSQPPCRSPCMQRLLFLVVPVVGGIVKVTGLLPGELPEKKLIFHVAQSSLFR